MRVALLPWAHARAARKPLTAAQVVRHHRVQFGLAVAQLLWCVIVSVLLVLGNQPLLAVPFVALAVYLIRVVRRRYARLRSGTR